MLSYWIDVEAADGTRYGPGPITTATGWVMTPRLDAAGTFSFSIPVSDPMSTYLANKRIVRCRGIKDGVVTELGAGIIDKIVLNPGNASMLQVSGPDIMAELATTSVFNLKVHTQDWIALDGYYGDAHRIWTETTGVGHYDSNLLDAHDGDLGTWANVQISGTRWGMDYQYLYVGCGSRYDKVRFRFHTFNVNHGWLQTQYYTSEVGWKDITVVDGTLVGEVGWAQDGDVTFVRPTDWARYVQTEAGQERYWMRFKLLNYWPDFPSERNADIAEIDVWGDVPTDLGVQQIMAEAPPGWVTTTPLLDPVAVDITTVWPKYIEYGGESVLLALVALAEQGGQEAGQAVREHFRLSKLAPRTLVWMGTDIASSGLRAIEAPDGIAAAAAPELVLISRLSETKDSAEIVTDIYPSSGDGITLSESDRTAPAGYTHVLGSQVIRHTQAFTDYGLIEYVPTFSELSMQQSDSISTDRRWTANAVFDRAVEYLRTHAQLAKSYDLEVVGYSQAIRVGDTIEVVYYEYRDEIQTVAIDTIASGSPLWITAAAERIDGSGISTIGLTVSTMDRDVKTDAGIVVDLVREKHRSAGNMSNISGASTGGASTPPSAGPDIRVTGYQVSRAGNGVLLFSGSGLVLAEYAADLAGLTAALAAMAAGDIVGDWTGTIVGNVTIPAGGILKGRSRGASILDGLVTGGAASRFERASVIRVANQAGALVGVTVGDTGTMYLDDVTVDCQNSGGPAYDIEMILGGGITARETELLAEVGTDGYAAWIEHGSFRHESGKAKGTTATHPYWLEV